MNESIRWKKITSFSILPQDDLIQHLTQLIEMYNLQAEKFEYGSTAQAVLLSGESLFYIAYQAGSGLLVVDIADNEAAEDGQVLFVSTGISDAAAATLLSSLADGTFTDELPPWIAVQKMLPANAPFLQQIKSFGAQNITGTLTFQLPSDQQVVVELYRMVPTPSEPDQMLRRGFVGIDKMPEGADNLDQRSDWFKKRTGK